MTNNGQKDIKVIYDQVCVSHDGIADFRAKLLALLPIASGVGIFLLVDDGVSSDEIIPHLLPIGIFGALITLGLFFYELRGIQKCNGLIACAKRLEKELLPEELNDFGAFNFGQKALLGGIVGATGAALVIYPMVIGAWVYIAGLGASRSLKMDMPGLVVAAAVAIAFLLFGLAVNHLGKTLLRKQINDLNNHAELIEKVRQLLETEGEILNPLTPNLHRELDDAEFSVWKSEELGVVRSLIKATDLKDPQAVVKKYRSIQVFEKHQGEWRCVEWQVTEIR